jgi:hypothetical protein
VISRSRPRRIAARRWGVLTVLVLAGCLGPTLAGSGAVYAEASAPAPSASAIFPGAPPVTVLHREGRVAPGFIFITPSGPEGTFASGPEIVDNDGRIVWFQAVPSGQQASDFRAQTYLGRTVLTWWQGTDFGKVSSGVDEIVDRDHHVVATVRGGNGLPTDGHEFLITPWNTALITVYNLATADLTSIGGAPDQQVIDGIVQEIDIRTGRVLFEWHSIGHVPFSASLQPLPTSPTDPWDYFHINAVHLDTDRNLVISARHTWAIYKVGRRSGDVLWELGGVRSSFALGSGVKFAWQHDPEVIAPGTLTIFDNESNGTPTLPSSRVITVRLDLEDRTATLVSSLVHPLGLSASSQGNAQTLRNGDVFVGWGHLGRFSELDRSGRLLLDAALPSGFDTYRSYRLPRS